MAREWGENGIASQVARMAAADQKSAADIDSEETGDGRTSRSQTFAFLAVTDERDLWIVPYSEIRIQKVGKEGGETASLQFTDEDGERLQLTFKGTAESIGNLMARLAAGRRELIRPSAETIRSVRMEKVD